MIIRNLFNPAESDYIPEHPVHFTNADVIRAMTDKELAKMISGIESRALYWGSEWPLENWIDWLRQEAKR